MLFRSMLHTYPPNNIDQTNDIMDTCFATAAYASKVAIHCTLNISPGTIVFQRDMIQNIPSSQICFIVMNDNKTLLMNDYNMLTCIVEHLIMYLAIKY